MGGGITAPKSFPGYAPVLNVSKCSEFHKFGRLVLRVEFGFSVSSIKDSISKTALLQINEQISFNYMLKINKRHAKVKYMKWQINTYLISHLFSLCFFILTALFLLHRHLTCVWKIVAHFSSLQKILLGWERRIGLFH